MNTPERDIVETLRRVDSRDILIGVAPGRFLYRTVHDICSRAANEIERLRYELQKVKAQQ